MARQRLFNSEEAHSALIEAGLELLLEASRPGSVGVAKLSDAITRSGVPRPSAYRLFGSGSQSAQEEFLEHLAVAVISQAGPSAFGSDADRIRSLLAEAVAAGAVADEDRLTPLLSELLRISGSVLLDHARSNPALVMTLSAAASTHVADPSESVRSALAEVYAAYVGAVGRFIGAVLDAFGLRVQPGRSMDLLARMVIDATTGAVLASRVATPVEFDFECEGDSSGAQSWTALSLSLGAILASATEPDPRRVVSAALDQCVTSSSATTREPAH